MKVLEILAAVAVAAPGKSMPDKEFAAQVVLIDLIGKADRAVCIVCGGGRRDCLAAVLFVGDARVIARIDVQGKP